MNTWTEFALIAAGIISALGIGLIGGIQIGRNVALREWDMLHINLTPPVPFLREEEYEVILRDVGELMDAETPEDLVRLEVLARLIEEFEEYHYPQWR